MHPANYPSSQDLEKTFRRQRGHRLCLKHSDAAQRCARLQRLKDSIIDHADEIDKALHNDLRKPRMGIKHFEITSVLDEIDLTLASLASWMAPEEIDPSPPFTGSAVRVIYEPRGVVGLFGPWNFPFALVMAPLVQIIAAGNTCIVKPNEMQPTVSAITARIIREVFDEREVAVFEGDVSLAEQLLELPFDHIFFTGSPAVGKRIMAAAAKHLTSVTLELGGKCPAILDESVDLAKVVEQVVGGRFINAGQLCLSVDHVWLPASMLEPFITLAKRTIAEMFYLDGNLQRDRLARMVDLRNFERVKGYLDEAVERGASVAIGGECEVHDLTIHPTVIVDTPLDTNLMQSEIFGPLLPVNTYETLEEVTAHIEATGKPLAIYAFSNSQTFIDQVLLQTSSGGFTGNGVMLHYAEKKLPFGGCNQSGIGRSRGVHGFRELSNARSVFIAPA